MKKCFDLIVFDWDGTLMDSAEIIVRSIRKASLDADFPVPEPEAARHVIGLGLMEAMAHLFPDAGMPDYGKLSEHYRRHYLKAWDEGVYLFEGAREMIEQLRNSGHLLAVATGKGRSGLDSAFEISGIGRYFHASRCADETFSKPHPAMLLELMEELGASAERTLMIGDTTHDLQMAVNAGVASLAMCHGAHPRENLEALNPLACLGDFDELRAWFDSHT
ncbi:MAG: HAD-IA family hydrolase [Burkholderiales bacterium]|nr:HAD-IA family hydrolase [Burkholderiales bacterium]